MISMIYLQRPAVVGHWPRSTTMVHAQRLDDPEMLREHKQHMRHTLGHAYE